MCFPDYLNSIEETLKGILSMSHEARREYTLIRAFGITTLAILTLVGIAGAAPFAYVTSMRVDTGTGLL